MEGRGAKIDLRKAAEFNDRCLEKEPASIYALAKRAVIIYKTVDKAQAESQLARLAEEYAADAEKLGIIGWAYYLCGELDRAQETNHTSLALAELPWTFFNDGFYSLLKGKVERARQIYSTGLKKFGPLAAAIRDLYEVSKEGKQAAPARAVLKDIFRYAGNI